MVSLSAFFLVFYGKFYEADCYIILKVGYPVHSVALNSNKELFVYL